MAALLASLPAWTTAESQALAALASHPLHNRRNLTVGAVQAVGEAFPPVSL